MWVTGNLVKEKGAIYLAMETNLIVVKYLSKGYFSGMFVLMSFSG